MFKSGEVVRILPALAIAEAYDYLIPEGMTLSEGEYVDVPVGNATAMGVVWGAGQPQKKLKAISKRHDVPAMPDIMRDFINRVAHYTISPLGAVLRLATRAPGLTEPATERKYYALGNPTLEKPTPARQRVLDFFQKHPEGRFIPSDLAQQASVGTAVQTGLEKMGCLIAENAPRDRPFTAPDLSISGKELSGQQKEATNTIQAAIKGKSYLTFLLQGVTGSGKTEVYLEAVAETLRSGRQALVMLPEIALTSEFLKRIEQRFGARPAEWHSECTPAERRRTWRAVANGDAKIIVGARSSLFLPFPDLGLIVVDEEHEGSYKQEEGVRYNARDMAVLRMALGKGVCVLASATPALESYANAETGKYKRLRLTERFGNAVMPKLASIDLRVHTPAPQCWISDPLRNAITETITRGEQALLFLNRRGYAPLTLCRHCGHRFGCPDCDAWLVNHRFQRRMTCHQCGHNEPEPYQCPECGTKDKLAACGPGVERLAEEAAEKFPDARIAVLSSDLLPTAKAQRVALKKITDNEVDLIIGTQLVSKGHNFPMFTMVGVMDADLGLQGGDLRAAERTFQLLRQVAGRAGRAAHPGQALIQTIAPEHPVMQAIISDDEEAFWSRESDERKQSGAPPYIRYVAVILSGKDHQAVWNLGKKIAASAAPIRAIQGDILGPAAAPLSMIRGQHRVRLLIRVPRSAPVQDTLIEWRKSLGPLRGVKLVFDVDPQSFL